ncbi:MAG: DNA protein [Campylobacterota bacterium]|nr:DNA protein [Campylobacterota bacterium]
MSKTTMIHARVEPSLKYESEEMLKSMGLNMTQAITLFLQQVRLQRALPFEVKLPNSTTQNIMKEVLENKNVEDFYFDELKIAKA